MKEIERYFRPEFIGRLDDVIVFRPLQPDRTWRTSYPQIGPLQRLEDDHIIQSADEFGTEIPLDFFHQRGLDLW